MCGKCYFLVTYIKLALCTNSAPVRRVPAMKKCSEPREAVRGGERKRAGREKWKSKTSTNKQREVFSLGGLSFKNVAILSGRQLHFVIKQFQ